MKKNKKAECIRNAINFSKQNIYHKFDKNKFDKDKFKDDIPIISPKLFKLLENIKKLDEDDFNNHGHFFKHLIYSDIKSSSYGIKMICSGLLSNDYNLIYDNKFNINIKKSNNNFALLSSINTFNKPFPVKLRKNIMNIFNNRPDNIFGDNIRFLLIDSGYKEGLDVFDIKYLHIFDNLLSLNEEKQVVGRGTRFCGQKGLDFDQSLGWILNVYRYNLDIDDNLQLKYNDNNAFNIVLRENGINLDKLLFANELEDLSRLGSVDYILTKSIHEFNKNIIGGNNSTNLYNNINSRIDNFLKIKKYINNINSDKCLKYINTYKGHKIYNIGNKFKIVKKIGNPSKYGNIYLTKGINKGKLLQFACKITPVNQYNNYEILLYKYLNNEILNNNNIHFPLIYKSFICNKKSSSNLPLIISEKKYNIIINELMDGDLSDFIHNFYKNYDFLLNSIQQCFISILSFHFKTNLLHNDCHWGNFLYHKIDSGGFFHYKIFNYDIYVENLGFLWIIWDFGLVKNIKNNNIFVKDFLRCIKAFINEDYINGGFLSKQYIINSDLLKISTYIDDILYKNKYNFDQSDFFKLLIENNIFLTKLPIGEKIINNNPFIIY